MPESSWAGGGAAAAARPVTLVSLEPGPGAAAGRQPALPGRMVKATVAGKRLADQEPR